MTIPEAAQLVIQAGAMAEGGEVFLLDMGQPVRIIDLARRMIELNGLQVLDETNPGGDIEIRIVGIRPGEKLFEELLIDENVSETVHPRIMKGSEYSYPVDVLQQKVDALMSAVAAKDEAAIRSCLVNLVPEYRCQ
jgi:FlaA1/EpsC-like NDP-sugar epimerase